MWFTAVALAGMPNNCAPPVVLRFVEQHPEVGSYERYGRHPLVVESATRVDDALLLWVSCQNVMGAHSQHLVWRVGDAPMEAVSLGIRNEWNDRWWSQVELSMVDVGWPETRVPQVRGHFAALHDHGGLRSDDMVVWAVGYPALEDRAPLGALLDGPRHGDGCPPRGLPDGMQTEVWMARAGRSENLEEVPWHADATVVTTHRWEDGALEVEERWAPTVHSEHTTVVRRTLSWQYGGLFEQCRAE